MIFSKAVLAACFAILGFLSLFVAALLAILAAMNVARGEPVAGAVVAGVAFAAGGVACRLIAARLGDREPG